MRQMMVGLGGAALVLACAGSAAAQGTDYSKVEIRTTMVAGSLHLLEGQGGVIGVLAGKTQAEVLAAKPTAEFDAKVVGGTPMTADRFVTQLYTALQARK